MRVVIAVLVLALTAATTPAASAQDPGDPGPLIQRLAALWTSHDAGAIARHAAGGGLELEIEGQPIGPVAPRKAAATLRRVFAARETVSVVTTLSSRVAGAEDRAFGELTWEYRAPGAESTERNSVFVGLVREGAGWRVSQIRILP